MASVAFLGLGAMGSRMAANLLKAGHAVAVWNRDAGRASGPVGAGATLAATPRAAVAGCEFAVAMVRDDAASKAVWLDPDNGALGGMPASAVALESSTVTVEWARELAGEFAAKRVAFLDAPVSGSTPQAEAAQLIFLVGGEAEVVERATPLMRAMGSAVHHAGGAGCGAAVKLLVNAMMGVQVAALAELLAAMRKSGVDEARAAEIFAQTSACSPAAKLAAGSMLARNYAPLFPVELVEKDLGYAARAAGGVAPVSEAARAVFEAARAAGHGAAQMTAAVELYR